MEATVHRPVSELDGRVAPRVTASLTALATSGCRTPNEAPEHARESPSIAFHSLLSPSQLQSRRRHHCSAERVAIAYLPRRRVIARSS